MDSPLQLDDNLQGGYTYCFTLKLDNWLLMPSTSDILNDLDMNAPTFITNYHASFASGIGLLTNYLNIVFTYQGDGSDVVSDVADELISAIRMGSNDNFSFEQATSGTAGISALSDVTAKASDVANATGSVVGTAIGSAAQGAAKNLGFSGWVVVAMVMLGLLAYFSATTGVRVHE